MRISETDYYGMGSQVFDYLEDIVDSEVEALEIEVDILRDAFSHSVNAAVDTELRSRLVVTQTNLAIAYAAQERTL